MQLILALSAPVVALASLSALDGLLTDRSLARAAAHATRVLRHVGQVRSLEDDDELRFQLSEAQLPSALMRQLDRLEAERMVLDGVPVRTEPTWLSWEQVREDHRRDAWMSPPVWSHAAVTLVGVLVGLGELVVASGQLPGSAAHGAALTAALACFVSAVFVAGTRWSLGAQGRRQLAQLGQALDRVYRQVSTKELLAYRLAPQADFRSALGRVEPRVPARVQVPDEEPMPTVGRIHLPELPVAEADQPIYRPTSLSFRTHARAGRR